MIKMVRMRWKSPAVLFLLCTAPLAAQVKVTEGTNQVSVEIGGKPYSTFVYGPDVMKAYLFPLRAADGTILTRGFPMEKVAGESTDHPHQRGVWFAHSDVNGFDFWNNEATYTTKNRGTIKVVKITKTRSGAASGEIDAQLEWRDPNGKPLLREDRAMVFAQGDANRSIDFDFTLTAIEPVKFGDEKDGVFGIRVAPWLEATGQKNQPAEPLRTLHMTNADGATGEKQVWGKRSNWVDYSGQAPDGKKYGIAIFDNPDNPRHPAYWHARGYGLFANNIFGERAFTGDKSKDGGMQLAPGEKLHFRYRVVIHPGDATDAHLSDLYASYAH